MSTQPFGGDTVAIPGITVTTDGSGNIPAGTLFPQGERMTVQVGKDKPLGVVIPSGGSCPVTFGALYASGLSGLPPGFGPLTGTFPIQVSAPPNPTASLANVTAEQGTGPKVQLSTGTTTTNDCVKFDANGNTVDAGAGCGTGTGGLGLVNKVFNATDVTYGALGNDIANDQPAIQAAYTAANATQSSGSGSAQAYLPAGTYRINAPIVVGHSAFNAAFVGAGYLQTYLDAHFVGPAIIAAANQTYPTFNNVSATGNIIPSGSGTSLTYAASATGVFNLDEVINLNTGAFPATGPFDGATQWDMRFFMRDDDTASTHCLWASDGGLNSVVGTGAPGLNNASFTTNVGAMGYLCVDGADQKLKGSLNVSGTEIRVTSGATTVTQGTVYEVELNLDASHNVNLYLGTGGTVTRVAQTASGGTAIKQRADESNYFGADIPNWPEAGIAFAWRGAFQSVQISNTARNTAASYTEDTAQFTSDANTLFLMNNGLSNFPSGFPEVQVDKGSGGGPWWIAFSDFGSGCCGGQQQLRDFQVIGTSTIGIFGDADNIDAERTPVVLGVNSSYAGIMTTANATFGSIIKALPSYPVTQATLAPIMMLGGIGTISDVNLQASNYPLVLNAASNAKNIFFQTNSRTSCAIVELNGGSTFDLVDADSENGGDFPWYCSQNAIVPTRITNSFVSDGSATAASSPFTLYGTTGKLTLDHNQIILPGGYTGTSIVNATNAHGNGGQQPATPNALVTFFNNDFDNANLHQEVPPTGVSYTNNGLAYDAKNARTTFADFEIPSIPQLTSNILDTSCTSPCSVTLPANIPQGQVIVVVFNFGSGATPSAPTLNSAGWTQGCAFDDHSTSAQNYITMWKVAGANDAGASVSFTFGGGGSSRDMHIAVVSNLNQYNPIGTCFTSTQASSTTFTLAGGTITNRNSRILVTVGNNNSLAETPTSPPSDFLKLDSSSTVPTWLYLPRLTTAPSITFSASSAVFWSGLQMELLPDSPQTTLAPFSAGVPPIYYGASYPLLRGVDLNGRDTVECNDNGTVTTSQNVIFTTNSCQKFTTATTGLTYTLQTAGIKTGQQVEIDSYITGAITGPLWATSSGAFKWLGGGPPTSSGTNGFVDLLYLKYDGVNWLETGESFALH